MMNQSVLQLFMAKQTANTQLQIQAQQNQVAQLAHTNSLRALAKSTQQRNFEHIFTSTPIFDSIKTEDVFLVRQEAMLECV